MTDQNSSAPVPPEPSPQLGHTQQTSPAQQPGSAGQPGPAPAAEAPSAPRPKVIALIAAAAALLVGLGAGALIGFFLFSESPAQNRAEANLQDGCSVLERLEDDAPLDYEELSLEDPQLWELQASGVIFMAAGTADDEYEELAELGSELQRGITVFDYDRVREVLDELHQECEAR